MMSNILRLLIVIFSLNLLNFHFRIGYAYQNLTTAQKSFKILALFSGSSHELAIDQRLGRQLLKLAAQRARQLYPQLSNGLELLVDGELSECSSPTNGLPSRLAQQFYPSQVLEDDDDQIESVIQFQANASRQLRRSLQENHLMLHFSRPDAIIGPTCDELVDLVARMAAYWNTPIYSVASVSAQFSRKDVYPTLTRLSPSAEHLSNFLLEVLQHFQWRHLAILVDKSQIESEILLDNLLRTFRRTRYIYPTYYELHHMRTSSLIAPRRPANTSQEACTKEARAALTGGARVARVFLLLLGDEQQMVRSLMLCAHELNMNNGEFTFLAPSLGIGGSSLIKTAVSVLDSNGDDPLESNENIKIKRMLESLMVLSVELPIGDQYNLFVEQALELASLEYPGVKFERSSLGPLAVALHDSLLLACEAHLRSHLSMANGSGSSKLIWDSSFLSAGLISSEIHINENGDQELDYVLSDFEPETSLMHSIASYSRNMRQLRFIEGAFIHWPARQMAGRAEQQQNQPPPDEPECGFTGEAEHCVDRENLHAALAILAVIAALVMLAAGFSLHQYKQIKYQMSLDDLWWRINWDELQFIQVRPDSLVSACNPNQLARALRSPSCANSIISGVSNLTPRLVPVSPSQSVCQADTDTPMTTLKRRPKPALPTIVTENTTNDHQRQQYQKAPSEVGSLAPSQVAPSNILEMSANKSALSSVIRSSTLAMYRNQLVIVKQLNTASSTIEMSRELLVELRSMREHVHENLAKFIGLCTDFGKLSIVYAYCSRGSLQDMLLNPSINMDWTLKYSVIGDLVNGLAFIHSSQLDFHGRLKSSNLVLDGRFTLKITDFGLQTLYSQLTPTSAQIDNDDDEEFDDGDDNQTRSSAGSAISRQTEGLGRHSSRASRPRDLLSLSVSQRGANIRGNSSETSQRFGDSSGYSGTTTKLKNRGSARYFWTAPEHLRNKNVHCSGSRKGDVYSFAIILWELLTRREPYHYGTNARPHWPTIRADRTQAVQATLGPNPDSTRTSNAGISTTSGLRGRRARGSSKVGIAPNVETASEASSHSRGSLQHSGIVITPSIQSAQENPTVPAGSGQAARSVRLSVITIGEEEPGCEDEPLDGPEVNSRKLLKESRSFIDAEEILDQVRMGILPEPVRPYLPNYVIHEVEPRLVELMRDCWAEVPNARPTLVQVRQQLRRITKGIASRNYLDNLLERLQGYAANLEQIVDAKSAAINEEKYKTEELLYQLLPRFVADRLKRDQPIVPQLFDGVTIFFSDIVGFEKYSSVLSPSELVDLLNSIYASFESIISSFDVTKIETIIDQFLVASGISLQSHSSEEDQSEPQQQQQQQQPQQQQVSGKLDESNKQLTWNRFKSSQRKLLSGLGSSLASQAKKDQSLDVDEPALSDAELNHYKRSSAEQIARMALCVRDLVKSLHFKQINNPFNIRIGIHSGKVCAGIVGVNRPKFCLIGDTVNVASRMHTNSKANRIQISATTKQLLDSVPGLTIEPRGKIEVKGKGMMETFWLESAY